MAEAKSGAESGLAGFAPAKINLALHVTGRRADGLHELDSLVAFADVGDRLTAKPALTSSLTVTGPMAAGVPVDGRNLVLKAAKWMDVPAAFELEKNLPAAAGIGGGSSDAAAALRLLADLSNQPIPGGAEALGADVPVCLLARGARMQGIGEVIEPVALPPLPCVLVNPGVDVPTAEVFSTLDRRDYPPMDKVIPRFEAVKDTAQWLARQRNDLEAPAIRRAPVVQTVLSRLAACDGVLLVRMSGSGATCFALFSSRDAARAAAVQLSGENPRWWVADTLLS